MFRVGNSNDNNKYKNKNKPVRRRFVNGIKKREKKKMSEKLLGLYLKQ